MGFADKIKNFFSRASSLSEEFFEELTDLLVEGDFGAAEAYRTAERLRDCCKRERIASSGELRVKLAELLEEMLNSAASPAGTGPAGNRKLPEGGLPPPDGTISVILLLGVNGVGKTTSAAKLASLYRDVYKGRPILAAADTFRAAAIDQLKIHGDRLGIRVVAHQYGGDPAAVVYDAVEAARAGGGDLVIADTAGRMHTKSALVEELRKIDRVLESRAVGGRYIKYLVLDATTGRNVLAQAEIFCDAVSPEGVILTKYDSTARGGVVFSLASELRLPVIFLCTGEKYGDIKTFDPHAYAEEFAGLA